MDVRTNGTQYKCQNKADSVIKIIKGKSKRRRVQRNIPKRVWDFGTVREYYIYYLTAGNYEPPDL